MLKKEVDMIKWLSKESFNQTVLENFKNEVFLKEFCSFNVERGIIEKIIPVEPETVLEPAPFTEPGPHLNWFGIGSDIFFTLTLYLSTFNSSSSGLISIFVQNSIELNWSLFKKIKFPPEIIKNINWISGNEKTDYSVYSNDENNLIFEIYRAEGEDDASNLMSYLLENGYNKELVIGESENLNLDWVVENEEKCIARYTSRYTAENFALRKSKTENTEFLVFSPDLAKFSKIKFINGEKVET
jgi:hypothetical protein